MEHIGIWLNPDSPTYVEDHIRWFGEPPRFPANDGFVGTDIKPDSEVVQQPRNTKEKDCYGWSSKN